MENAIVDASLRCTHLHGQSFNLARAIAVFDPVDSATGARRGGVAGVCFVADPATELWLLLRSVAISKEQSPDALACRRRSRLFMVRMVSVAFPVVGCRGLRDCSGWWAISINVLKHDLRQRIQAHPKARRPRQPPGRRPDEADHVGARCPREIVGRFTGMWPATSRVSGFAARARASSEKCSTPTASAMSRIWRLSSLFRTSTSRSGRCMTGSAVVATNRGVKPSPCDL